MILSTHPAFIFVAVPKTGSSSIERSLKGYQDGALSKPFNKHVLAMKLQKELPRVLWEGSYRAAFVREPFDWLHSWYRYRQRDALRNPAHPRHGLYTGQISFDQFALTFSDTELMLKQSDFICTHAGELLVNFVGRFESLQRDYVRLCHELSIEAVELPLVNASEKSAAGLPQISDVAKEYVEEYFRQDFELFGY